MRSEGPGLLLGRRFGQETVPRRLVLVLVLVLLLVLVLVLLLVLVATSTTGTIKNFRPATSATPEQIFGTPPVRRTKLSQSFETLP